MDAPSGMLTHRAGITVKAGRGLSTVGAPGRNNTSPTAAEISKPKPAIDVMRMYFITWAAYTAQQRFNLVASAWLVALPDIWFLLEIHFSGKRVNQALAAANQLIFR